jgi:hypothetical protein
MASKYKDILDKIDWSFSTLHLYETCAYGFYNKKICDYLGIDNAFAEIGRYGHEINEKIFKSEFTIDEALKNWISDFDDHVFSYISESSKEKKYLAFCDYLAEFDESIFDKYDILDVETKFNWKVGKYNCVGLVDLVLREKSTQEIILEDHKSAAPFFGKKGQLLKSQTENFNSYKKQMYMYCKPIYEKYGVFPSRIEWNHMFDKTKTSIPFDMNDYNETQEWVKETIRKIYKDTKFEASKSYMMCYQLCNYRCDCEYKTLEEGE